MASDFHCNGQSGRKRPSTDRSATLPSVKWRLMKRLLGTGARIAASRNVPAVRTPRQNPMSNGSCRQALTGENSAGTFGEFQPAPSTGGQAVEPGSASANAFPAPLRKAVAHGGDDVGARQSSGKQSVDRGAIFIGQFGERTLTTSAIARRAAIGLAKTSSWNGWGSWNGRPGIAAASTSRRMPVMITASSQADGEAASARPRAPGHLATRLGGQVLYMF